MIAIIIGLCAEAGYVEWRDRHVPRMSQFASNQGLSQLLCVVVALIVIVPFSTNIPIAFHLIALYLVIGLVIIGRDFRKPLIHQPRYILDKRLDIALLSALFWPIIVFLKIMIAVRQR